MLKLRLALSGTLVIAVLGVGGCSSPGNLTSEGINSDPTGLVQSPAEQELNMTEVVEPTEVWGMWSPPPLGKTSEDLTFDQSFRPCKEIPDSVAKEIGITLLRDQELPRPEYHHACPFELTDSDYQTGEYSLATSIETTEEFVESSAVRIDHKIPGFPEALSTTSVITGLEGICESVVETTRGTVSVTFIPDSTTDLAHDPDTNLGEASCAIPDQILTKLFKGNDHDN